MRLDSVRLTDYPPIRLFEATGLADTIVIAGPNGVGKTRFLDRLVNQLRAGGPDPNIRITIAATSNDEETAWGKKRLDSGVAEDLASLRATLQKSRARKNWSSSLVNFESDRSIRNLQPLQFTWDLPDPDMEAISWDLTFGYMRDRFQDTLHSMFRMIEAQKQSIANRAIQLRREGKDEMHLTFSDPMQPFKEIFSLLLAPKVMLDPTVRDQRLTYQDGASILDFAALSSGEREVVNIAFDFLLRKPTDCIVFFDEPELHLHPELSYRLIRALRAIGERNQLVLSTHSPDVITASLDQSVIFLSPPVGNSDGTDGNQAIAVKESDETQQALRLLGQSIGIVALGRRIVLIEGSQSSLDKQTYGSILGPDTSGMVLVPSGGKHTLEAFDLVYDAVLSRTIWGVQFFMLCDGDSIPPESPGREKALASGRLRALKSYHLENYFLDEKVWAKAFEPMEPANSWLRNEREVRERFREIARKFTSYAVALHVAQLVRQEVGNVDVLPANCHGKDPQELKDLFRTTVMREKERVSARLSAQRVDDLVEARYAEITRAIDDDSDLWKRSIPGKPLLGAFASDSGFQPARAKALYLAASRGLSPDPFAEVRAIFKGWLTHT